MLWGNLVVEDKEIRTLHERNQQIMGWHENMKIEIIEIGTWKISERGL